MRLQEVLKEREAEITVLEASLNEKEQASSNLALSITVPPPSEDPSTHLSPSTAQKFQAIRKSMELYGVSPQPNGVDADTEVDESLDRLNELMLYDLLCLARVEVFSPFTNLAVLWHRRSRNTKRWLIP